MSKPSGIQRLDKVLSLKADAIQGNKMAGDAGGIGNLDSWDDVIFPGAFTEGVIADFLGSGFVADGHDWTKMIGMPLVAEVRGNLLYTECEFHSTEDAQAVKTKCAERIDRGLKVGLSVGIGMYESSIKSFASGPALLAYAASNGYDMSLFDADGIRAHARRCRGILKIDKWYEYSPVPVPANPSAWAAAVKTAPPTGGDEGGSGETGGTEPPATPEEGTPAPGVAALMPAASTAKGEYFSAYDEATMTMAALHRLGDALYYDIFWDCVYYDEDPLAERRAKLAGALEEYRAIVLRVFDALMTGAAEEGAETAATATATTADALTAIKALWADPKTTSSSGALPVGASFDQQLQSALAAVKGCSDRARAVQALRVKEGRGLSTARQTQIAAQRDELAACVKSLDDLLAPHATPPAPPSPEVAARALALRARQIARNNRQRQLLS